MNDASTDLAVAESEWRQMAALFREEAGLAGNPRRASRHLMELGRMKTPTPPIRRIVRA